MALVVLVLDLVTKWIVSHRIDFRGEPLRIVGDLVRFNHVRNSGSAFSLFQGGRIAFIAFSILSIALILSLARSRRFRSLTASISLGMILGGALGNLYDRILYGAVTDWIDIGIGSTRWPTFNVADIGVTIGVLLLIPTMLREPRRQELDEEPRPTDGAV